MNANEPAYPLQEAPLSDPVPARTARQVAWIASLALLVLGAAAWAGIDRWRAAHAEVVAESATVVVDTFAVEASLPGTIKQVLVKPGDTVKRGQVVALYDDSSLLSAVRQDQLAVDQALKEEQATEAAVLPPPIVGSLPAASPPAKPTLNDPAPLTLPDQRVAARKEHAASQVRQAELARQREADLLTAAQSDLTTATQQAKAARAPLEGLQSSLEMAKAQRDKFQDLYNQGIISRREFQAKQADVDTAQAAVDQVQKQISDADGTVKQSQDRVDAIQLELSTLTTQLQAAQRLFASIKVPDPVPKATLPEAPRTLPKPKPMEPAIGLAPVRVAFKQNQHRAADAKLAAARAVLSKDQVLLNSAQVVAAEDGVVRSVDVLTGWTVHTGETLLKIGKVETARVVALVPHGEALRVRKGQGCTIAVPGTIVQKIQGVVDHFIDPGTEAVPAKLEIRALGDPRALPPGRQVTAVVHPG